MARMLVLFEEDRLFLKFWQAEDENFGGQKLGYRGQKMKIPSLLAIVQFRLLPWNFNSGF
ncbi:unnamed protein product [Prunus brigantina]